MARKPLKRTGFSQGLFQQSSTKKEEIGTLRITAEGNKYRYARAGASALAAGKLNVAAALDADWMNEACASAHAIGDTQIAETITSTTVAENYFNSGTFAVNDATGEGHQYQIDSNSAVAAGTAITLTLNDPIRVALVASTSEFSLYHNPQMAVIESATLAFPSGVAPMVVTGNYYFWNQTGGLASVLSGNTDAVGKPVFQSTSVAGTVSGADVASYYPQVGIVFGTAGVSTEYKPIWLTID